MNRLFAALAATLSAAYLAPSAGRAATMDLSDAFPDNQGDNNIFLYAYSQATNTYHLLSDCGVNYFCRPEEVRWHNPNISKGGWLGPPWIAISPSGTASNPGSPEDGVIAWAVPTSGYYRIKGSFYLYPQSGNGAEVYIKHGDAALFSSYIAPGGTQAYDIPARALNAGDLVYFGANARNTGGFSELNDWPYVNGQITLVSAPEAFGESIGVAPGYEFSIEQGSSHPQSIQLTNLGNTPRSASLEVASAHTDLAVSVATPSPVVIPARGTAEVTLVLDASSAPFGDYDGILLKLAIDDGSVQYSNITVHVRPSASLPDLTVSSSGVRRVSVDAGTSVTIAADVHNKGSAPAANIEVRFYELGNLIGTTVLDSLPPDTTGIATIIAPITTAGDHLIRVVVDPSGAIPELDEANNEASKVVQPTPAPATQGGILVTGGLPAKVYAGSLFNLSGQAVYDLYIDGVRYTDYVVEGAPVQVTVQGSGSEKWLYGGVHSDTNGVFREYLQAPTAPGSYRLFITVTDKTFVGTRELVFSVVEAPTAPPPPPMPPPRWPVGSGEWIPASGDTWEWRWTSPPLGQPPPNSDIAVYAENIHFSNNNPAANEEITLFAELSYWASSTSLVARDVPVSFYMTYPGAPKMLVGHAVVERISVGAPDFGSRYVFATWRNERQGVYIVEVAVDPSYVEQNILDNAATRAIIVGQYSSTLGAVSGQANGPWGGISNAIISVLDVSGALIGSTVTDAAGSFIIASVPPGQVQVRIEPPAGYVPDAGAKSVEVSANSISTVDFLLTQVVLDAVPPTLALPQDIVAEAHAPSGATVAYEASATDLVDGAITPTCTPASGSTFPLGVTMVECTAADRAGNTATGHFRVSAQDTTPPSIVCPPDVAATQGQPLALGSPAVADSVDPAPLITSDAPATFAIGKTTVTWRARDFSGNETTCAQQVTLSNRPPVASPTATPSTGVAPLRVQFAANASDPDGDPLSISWDFGDGSTSEETNPAHVYAAPGTYTAWLTVSDGHASASQPQTIAVGSAITLDVRLAAVKWWREAVSGLVTLWADFRAPMPGPDDLVQVRFDGIQLLSAPFSAFKQEGRSGAYVLAKNGVVGRLDFKKGRLLVLTPKLALAKLDNSNGVDAELTIGNAIAVENVTLAPLGKGLLVYRRQGCEGNPGGD